MSSNKPHYLVVSVQGRDQKGVVAKFATYMAAHGLNIEDTHRKLRAICHWWIGVGSCCYMVGDKNAHSTGSAKLVIPALNTT